MSTFLGVGPSARSDEERSLRATLRLWCISAVVFTALSVGSVLLLLVALLTLFQFRRMYLALSTWIGRAVLALWGVRLEVVGALPFPRTQTVYVSNHTSSVDMFVLIALGLPGARFFLSGFLRKILPLGLIGYVTGIFWTVPQEYPEARKRIFARAAATLKRTGESCPPRDSGSPPASSGPSTRAPSTWRPTSRHPSSPSTSRSLPRWTRASGSTCAPAP